MILLASAAFSAFVALWVTIVFSLADRKYVRLKNVEPGDDWAPPKVSIVVAARNEQRDIEQAMLSLLRLEYEPLQVTVVNDRSTDETGAILDRLAADHPQLNVVHLKELPEGWLGKNHALQFGADRSDGEWLLFTDADIIFEPSSLRRAVWFAEQEQLGHLAAAPDIAVDGFMLNAVVATFVIYFNAYFRPWRARDPKSDAFIGVGAFNLVRADAYREVEGHSRLRMRPDDDVKLGKVLKQGGHRQDIVIAAEMISVRWYASVGELVRGLEKNSFAGVEYNPLIVVFGTASMLFLNVGPFVGAILAGGWAQVLFAFAAVLWLYCCWQSCWNLRQSTWTCVGFPFAVLLLVYVQWRTMILNYWQDGIRWRDTHYSLRELKANRV